MFPATISINKSGFCLNIFVWSDKHIALYHDQDFRHSFDIGKYPDGYSTTIANHQLRFSLKKTGCRRNRYKIVLMIDEEKFVIHPNGRVIKPLSKTTFASQATV